MKITHLAAAVAMIAACGLSHADEAAPPPPPPQGYGPGPAVGPGPGGPGYGYEGDGYEKTIVRRRTIIAPTGIAAAPPIAGLPELLPAMFLFPPEVSGGCGVLQNRERPDLFRVLVLWRNDAPPLDTGVVESRFVDRHMARLRAFGYCVGGPRAPVMRLN